MENRKIQVVMLPTEKIQDDNAVIWKEHWEDGILRSALKVNNPEKTSQYCDSTSQHLYFLSDEEIKESEYFYNDYESVKKALIIKDEYSIAHKKVVTNIYYGEGINQYYTKNDELKKIIATTDTSLREHDDTVPYPKTRPALPQPSDNFIKKYVEEYNKGNVITEVLVEYKECGTDQNPNLIVRKEDTEGFGFKIGLKPKVSQDNTIIIHPINKTYTRDEVNSIIDKAWELGAANGDAESLPEAKEELEKYKKSLNL